MHFLNIFSVKIPLLFFIQNVEVFFEINQKVLGIVQMLLRKNNAKKRIIRTLRDQDIFSGRFFKCYFCLPSSFSWIYALLSFPDTSYLHYLGNSYLEFQGIDLDKFNNITVRFQTMTAQGTLLYVDQGPVNGFFFMKLFIQEGILQVKIKCSEGS